MNRYFESLAFAAAAISITASPLSNAAETPAKPNILFILADDLGYGELGCYGQKLIQTPSLDRMAAEGLRFTRHYAGAAVCGPSRACLMTGKSQAIGFIKGNPGKRPERENLRPEDVTVAELLQKAGYETACIGKWGLGALDSSGYATRKGFDSFLGYDTHHAAHDYYPKELCHNEGMMKLKKGTYSDDVFTREAISFLEKDRDKPFFLYLAYTIPHSPYNPPDVKPYADKKWPETHKKYAAMITRMDRDIGRILDTLTRTGQAKKTLVIFASDNGPQSNASKGENAITRFFDSNGPHRGVKRDVYNGGVLVPFIAWWPGTIAPGTTSDHISAFQDFMPAACELAGVRPDPGTDGISSVPTLLGRPGEQKEHDRLYWEFIFMSKTYAGRQAVLDVKRNIKGVRFGRFGEIELYDLTTDPGEKKNIADAHPELARELSHYLDNARSESKLWPISMHDKGWNP